MPAPMSAPPMPAPAAITLVLGASDAQREAYADELSGRLGIPRAAGRNDLADVIETIADAAVDAQQPGVPRAVVPVPRDVDATELLPTRVAGRACVALVAVVDAPTIVRELGDDSYLDRFEQGRPVVVAQAAVTMQHLELAELIVVRQPEQLPARALARLAALLAHLNPAAHISIDAGHSERSVLMESPRREAGRLEPGQRAGWIHVLNGEFRPRFTDAAVQMLRYEHPRPLHPHRLTELLSGDLTTDRYGTLVRSAGFCRLASRPDRVALWSHIGRMISFEPLAADIDCTEFGAVGQELAFVGIHIDRAGLAAALDACALTDDEFLAGSDAWRSYRDDLPEWVT